MVRVLVVEDERKLAEVVAAALRGEHYDVVVARTGEDGFFRASAEVFDLVVLDLMLPGRGGLEYLLRHQGHLVSREMLAREVWKEPRRATPLDNVIDVQMARLRKKVDSDGGTRLIHTVRGVGFVLREGEP